MAELFPALSAAATEANHRPALRVATGDPEELTHGELTHGELTYGELAAACANHAATLASAGIGPGARVGVWTDPSLATAVALVGNAMAGVTTVPLNPKLGARELEHILGDAQVSHVVGDAERANAAAPASALLARVDTEATTATLPARDADDQALLVLYTSGTTGAPKGAVITAANAAANLDGLAAAWRWTERDTVVHALPLFHVHGLVLGLFGSLRAGGCLHWLGRFDPAATARAVAGGDTILFAVPTMYHRLADAAEASADIARDLGGARLLISGSAGLPVRDHRRIEAITGRGVYERYGLTETLINCAVRTSGPPRPGYVGPPVDGVELRLVDDQRRPLDAAAQSDDTTIGEVAVRGASVFRGYLNRPEATAAARDDQGWFYTGDLATRSADGSVRIVGRRATDLIKTGGYKVGAGEIESCLLEADGVAEVAVVGVPDDDLGERIVAFVVARPGTAPAADALIDRVAGDLSPHKRPREIRFVDALPRNAMGKVQKKRLLAP